MFTVRSLIENVFPVTGKNSPPKTLLDFPQKLHKRGFLNPVPEFTPQTVDHEVVALLKQSDRPRSQGDGICQQYILQLRVKTGMGIQ